MSLPSRLLSTQFNPIMKSLPRCTAHTDLLPAVHYGVGCGESASQACMNILWVYLSWVMGVCSFSQPSQGTFSQANHSCKNEWKHQICDMVSHMSVSLHLPRVAQCWHGCVFRFVYVSVYRFNMYINIFVLSLINSSLCVCVHTCIWVYLCVCVCVGVCIRISECICVCVCIRVSECICVCADMHANLSENITGDHHWLKTHKQNLTVWHFSPLNIHQYYIRFFWQQQRLVKPHSPIAIWPATSVSVHSLELVSEPAASVYACCGAISWLLCRCSAFNTALTNIAALEETSQTWAWNEMKKTMFLKGRT